MYMFFGGETRASLHAALCMDWERFNTCCTHSIHSISNPAAIQAHPLSPARSLARLLVLCLALALRPMQMIHWKKYTQRARTHTHTQLTQPNNQKGGAWSIIWKMFRTFFSFGTSPIHANRLCLRAAIFIFHCVVLPFAHCASIETGCAGEQDETRNSYGNVAFGGRCAAGPIDRWE